MFIILLLIIIIIIILNIINIILMMITTIVFCKWSEFSDTTVMVVLWVKKEDPSPRMDQVLALWHDDYYDNNRQNHQNHHNHHHRVLINIPHRVKACLCHRVYQYSRNSGPPVFNVANPKSYFP